MFRGTWRLCCLQNSRKPDQSRKSGWWAGWQTAHQGSSCFSAASHLPLNIWIPQGSDQKAHAGPVPVLLWKTVDKESNWEVWPQMEPRANFPELLALQGRLPEQPLLTPFLLSWISCLQLARRMRTGGLWFTFGNFNLLHGSCCF